MPELAAVGKALRALITTRPATRTHGRRRLSDVCRIACVVGVHAHALISMFTRVSMAVGGPRKGRHSGAMHPLRGREIADSVRNGTRPQARTGLAFGTASCGYQRAVRWPRFEVGGSEDGAFWTVFLRPWKTRGHLDERPERSGTRLTVAWKEDGCLFDLTGRRSRVSTGAESTVSAATQGAGIGTCRTLDGSLVSVGSTRTPRCRSCVGHEERTRHWPVDPAANTTPSARVLSDATWWVGRNRLRVWAIGPVLATDLSGRTGRCTAAQ